jgi:hypothetical protein
MIDGSTMLKDINSVDLSDFARVLAAPSPRPSTGLPSSPTMSKKAWGS